MYKPIPLLIAALLIAGCGVASRAPAAAPGPAPQQRPAAPLQAPADAATPRLQDVCNRPEGSSGVKIFIYPGDSDSTLLLKPGWTIPMANNWFSTSFRFGAPVDRSSVKVSVAPAPWQSKYEPRNEPPGAADSYTFTVMPGQMEQRGPEGKVTVTVTEAKGTDGRSLISQPIQYSFWAFAPSAPGSPVHPGVLACRGLEVPPPGAQLLVPSRHQIFRQVSAHCLVQKS